MKKMSFGWLALSIALACLVVSCQKESSELLPLAEEGNLALSSDGETLTEEEFWESMEASDQFEAELAAYETQVRSEVSTSGLSVQNGVLVFESIPYYQSIVDLGDDMTEESPDGDPQQIIADGIAEEVIEEYVKTINFDSYGSIHGTASEFQDPFIDAILNEDRIVQIGDWLIKIDYLQETVWTIDANTTDAYESLLNESGNGLVTHGIGDDVLYQLEVGNLAEDRGCGGIGGLNQHSQKYLVNPDILMFSGIIFRRYGIYFRMVTEARFTTPVNNLNNMYFTMQIKGPEAWRRRRPCRRSKHIGTHPAGDKQTITNKNQVIRWVFYSSSRNLNGYHLFVRARGAIFDYQSPGLQWAFTNWRGRNINSPY
ncbi:MAG: hypothetical protein AAF146_07760 [Bacteroidota bacterium]